MFSSLVLLVFLFTDGLSSASEPKVWRYDLRAGDHLVYRYTFERVYRGEDAQSRTRATFTTHVVVLGRQAERLSVGFQRNRESAELLDFKERGRDKLAQEVPKFRERMSKRPQRFSEAMEFNAAGEPLTYWEAARETPSKLILAVHEIEALPAMLPEVGESWQGGNLLGIRFKRVGRESVGQKLCDRVDGADSGGSVRLQFWWCDETGVIEKLEFNGEYSVPGGTVAEAARFEMVQKSRDEGVTQWVGSPEVRDAAMQGVILSPWVEVQAKALDAVLASSDVHSQSLALTVLLQRRVELRGEQRRALAESPDPGIRRLTAAFAPGEGSIRSSTKNDCSMPERTFKPERIGTTVRLVDSATGQHPYMIRVPGDYRGDKKVPLLIYLSGGSGLAIDGVNTADDMISSTGYLVLYPQAGDYWWSPAIEERINQLLQQTLRDFNVDTNRVYIAGFSNGGTGALDLAELWPHRFAAVVSLMGAGECNAEVAAGLKNLANLPLLQVHGEKDERIGLECSRRTFESIKEFGPKSPPVLKVLEKREHDVTLQQDGGLTLPFFDGKTRDAWPKQFTAIWGDTRFHRRYWVELIEKGSGRAEAQARISSANDIEISAHGIKRIRVLLSKELVSNEAPIRITINKKKVFEGAFRPNCRAMEESARNEADSILGYHQALDFEVP